MAFDSYCCWNILPFVKRYLIFYSWLLTAVWLHACARKNAPSKVQGKSPPSASAKTSSPSLIISDVAFAGPAGQRLDRDFSRGEKVYCLFTITHFTYHKRKAHIQADLQLLDARRQVVYQESNLELLKGAAPTLVPGTIRSAATLTLHPAYEPGRYTLLITVRDVLGKRQGKGEATFTLLGTPSSPKDRLTISKLSFASENQAPPGSIVPINIEVKGFSVAKRPGQRKKHVELHIAAILEDSQGHEALKRDERLLKTDLFYNPVAYPLEYQLPLPPELAPGTYRLLLTVRDILSKERSQGSLKLEVVPNTFSIHCLHLHDAANLPRAEFLLGEQIFIRLSVHGLKIKRDQIDTSIDLAIAGPDGGVYLAQKNASSISGAASRPFAKSKRYPVQLPIILPNLAPTGRYRLVIRARDEFARHVVVKEKTFRITGSSLPRLSLFKIDELEVRDRPDLPPRKGDTFGAGRSYSLVLRVGGGKIKRIGKMKYRIRIKGDLRLRDLQGKLVHESRDLFQFDRDLHYQPLRVLIPATWKVPSDLPGGEYDLELNARSLLDDQTSQMTRRVEIVSAGPAVPVQFP